MHPRQVPCWITHTNERTHEIIRSGFDRSPMFTGMIEGVGPRYCPSDRRQDQPLRRQGQPPDLPGAGRADDQRVLSERHLDQPAVRRAATQLVRSMRGLENAHILRPGYAIEYDYFDPRALKTQLRDAGDRRPVLRRPDQRHDRLRRGGGAGPVRRHQRRAAVPGRGGLAAAPRRGLPGRAGRRPDHQGRDRAVPHVHQPRRVPAAAARGQRRHAPDRSRARSWAWSTTRAGTPSTASATLFHVKQSG